MIITDIKTKVVNISEYTNWMFILVTTDEGIIGLGESTLDGCEDAVVHAINNLKEKYVGKNPIKDKLSFTFPQGGMIYAAAISGIDIALWDIRGKYFNVPIYQLLGGAVRKELQVYATFNRSLKTRTIDEFVQTSQLLVDKGFNAVKCAPFDDFIWQKPINKEQYLERGVNRFKAIRQAIGSNIELHVDNHWRFDYQTAVKVADMLRPFNPFWFEAPLSENNAKEIAKLRKDCGFRIAGGEMQTSSEKILPLLYNNSLDVYMPDVKYIGGITGILKTNSLIETFGKLIAPHNMTGPVATAASMHVSACMKNFITLENHHDESEWSKELSDLDTSITNGKMKLPTRAGLGVNLNIDLMDKHPYKKAKILRNNMLG